MKAKKWVISTSLDTKRIKTGYIEVLDQYDVWTTVVNINETKQYIEHTINKFLQLIYILKYKNY